MKKNRYQNNLKFLLSAPDLKSLPPDFGKEVAFIGASNVGKSSLLNTLAGEKNLARVGKTPGVTQFINVFVLDHKTRIIDLPGYGYAKLPLKKREELQEMTNSYLKDRESLGGLFVLTDSRHPLKPQDKKLISWAKEANLPICILLTKIDKLAKTEAMAALKFVQNEIPHCSAYVFSAENKTGLGDVLAELDHWLL